MIRTANQTWSAYARKSKKPQATRKSRKHLEDDEHLRFVRWFEFQYPQYKDLLHHSPNGGKRGAKEGKRFKDMGVRPGRPDIELNVPRETFHGLFIELKVGKNRLTDNQKDQLAKLREQGYDCHVCYGAEAAMQVVKGYLGGKLSTQD